MATTAEYLNQLKNDKQTLVDNLVAKGVEATSDETFTSLVPKVLDVPSGDISAYINTEITSNIYGALYAIENMPTLHYSEQRTINNIFNGMRGLKKMPIFELDYPSSLSGYAMFYYCNSLEDVSNLTKLDFSKNTSTNKMFYGCSKLTQVPLFDTSSVTDAVSMFEDCSSLRMIPQFDFSKVKSMETVFKNCTSLEEINEFDFPNSTSFYCTFQDCTELKKVNIKTSGALKSIGYTFRYTDKLESINAIECSNVNYLPDAVTPRNLNYTLTNLGGFINLGKAFTSKTTNSSVYTLNLSKRAGLTHESLMNVINGLYDLNLTYDVANGGTLYTQNLRLHPDCLALLSDEEIAIATNKGWTIATS